MEALACPCCLAVSICGSASAPNQPWVRWCLCAVRDGVCQRPLPKGNADKAAPLLPAFASWSSCTVQKGCGPLYKSLVPSHLALGCETCAFSFVLQACGCWAGTAFTFQDLFAVIWKHSIVSYSCLKLKEHCLRARGDPDLGALYCGYEQSMLLGLA